MGSVVNLAQVRDQRRAEAKARDQAAKPEWADDIMTLALYARMVKAEHEAEQARYRFEAWRDGLTDAWWNWPEDMQERVHENNRQWDHYIAMCAHLASLPAQTRAQASAKRNTIGKLWLKLDIDEKKYPEGTLGSRFEQMRQGCIADDHLFPRSMKLARA